MTISSTNRKAGPFVGNGVVLLFPFSFKVFKTSDVLVTFTDANGADRQLALDSDYSVTLNNNQDDNPGGVVTYPRAGSPGHVLAAPERLTITGDLAALQPTDLPDLSPWFPHVVEDALDRATILIQQLQEQINRSIKISVSDTPLTPLPTAPNRANELIGFDALGNVVLYPLTASIGAGDRTPFSLTAGVDFNPGDTHVVLPRAPGSQGNLEVNFDATGQDFSQWNVSGTDLNFSAPIPAGVTRIWGYIGTTLSTQVPPRESVGDNELVWGGILLRVVESIADLRKLDRSRYTHAFVCGYYAGTTRGGGVFRQRSVDSTSADDGGSIIVADDNARWERLFVAAPDVVDFGAVADNGITENGPMFQAWLDYITGKLQPSTRTGMKGRISGGRYGIGQKLFATFRSDNAINDDGDFRRLTIEGDGQANTYLIYKGPSGPTDFALTVAGYTQGANTDGSHLYLTLKGFRLWRDLSSPRVGGGLALTKVAYAHLEDFNVGNFNLNWNFTDVLGVTGIDAYCVGGNGGFAAQVSSFTRPNGYTFIRGSFSGNQVYAINSAEAANWKFLGTFIEGNGNMPIGSDSTVTINGGPAEGGCSVDFDNCYFENNVGAADINVNYNSAAGGTVSVRGTTFSRGSAARYNVNHISLSSTGGGKLVAKIEACGFKSFNDYVPSSSRPVIAQQTGNVAITESANYYQNAVERPNYQGYPAVGDGYSKLHMTGRITSAGGIVAGWNVDTVTKTGTGVYRINYKVPLVDAATTISIPTIYGAAGFADVTDEQLSYIEITTKNSAGAATDLNFKIVSYAKG